MVQKGEDQKEKMASICSRPKAQSQLEERASAKCHAWKMARPPVHITKVFGL